jgi:glycosyltransferase involved in cell wall biosynthesis
MNNLGVSIIICCYNSTARIIPTLNYIKHQQVSPGIDWEVILVDNNSNDGTSTAAYSAWDIKSTKIPFKIVEQAIPGLAHARRRGFEEAQYEFILMVDDDNWLVDTYVETVFELMSSNPDIGVLGGYGIEECEELPPSWFEIFKLSYAVGKHAENSGDITASRGDVYGAGATIRKSAWLTLKNNGFISIIADRTGKSLTSGGDNELCICIKKIGYKIWYDERLKFYHFIPRERLADQYLVALQQGITKSFCLMRPYFFALNPELGFEKRSSFKNHWLWFLTPRVISFIFKGRFATVINYAIKKRLSNNIIDALCELAYIKTIWLEKNKPLTHYKRIKTSKWFNLSEAGEKGN